MSMKQIIVVIGIIFLLSMSPNFCCSSDAKERNGHLDNYSNTLLEDSLDQCQLLWNTGIAVGCPDMLAQSFTPMKNTLTRVEILIYKTENVENEISLSIRRNIDGPDLTNTTMSIRDIYFDRTWIEFDFPDIAVTLDTTYYIVLKPLSGGINIVWNGYDNNNFDSYSPGEAWLYTGNQWSTDGFIIKDWSFKTYGYQLSQPPNIPKTPEGPFEGYSWIFYNYSTNTTDIDGDDVRFGWDWDGDDVVDEWTGFVNSGKEIRISHYWQKPGGYMVKVKAEDAYGIESNFSDAILVIITNNPPNPPSVPNGTLLGYTLEEFWYQTYTIDPDGDDICYGWDWDGDDVVDEWTSYIQSDETMNTVHMWYNSGNFHIKAKARDDKGALSEFSDPLHVIIVNRDNNPPEKPTTPVGPNVGWPDVSYSYQTYAIDPEGDRIWYLWDWDDGTNTSWIGPFSSGQRIDMSHSWNKKGTFQIKIKARDESGAESIWSDSMQINLPKSRSYASCIKNVLQHNGHMYPILRIILTSKVAYFNDLLHDFLIMHRWLSS